MGAGIEAGEGNRGFHLTADRSLGSEIGIGLSTPGQHGRCTARSGAFGLDLDFCGGRVVAIGNDPADPDDMRHRVRPTRNATSAAERSDAWIRPRASTRAWRRYTGKTDQQ